MMQDEFGNESLGECLCLGKKNVIAVLVATGDLIEFEMSVNNRFCNYSSSR